MQLLKPPCKPNWPFTLNRASTQANGLIGYWPSGPAGRTIYDLATNPAKGTMTAFTAATAWRSSINGGITPNYQNDGTTTMASMVTAGHKLALTTAVSASIWIATTSLTQYGFIAGVAVANGSVGGYGFYTTSTTKIGFMIDTYVRYADVTVPTDGTWHHLIGTWDGATIAIYLDGGKTSGTYSTALGPTYTNSPPAVIGKLTGGFSGASLFKADEFCIYNRCLSACEIAAKYHPLTRWALRYQPGVKRYLIPSAPAVVGSGVGPLIGPGRIMGGTLNSGRLIRA